MADRPVAVHVHADVEGWMSRLRRLEEVSRRVNAEWQMAQATWEPHDWSAF